MDTRILTVERSTSTAHRLAQYDGVCGDVHGHNMEWQVEVKVDMAYGEDDNMPVDLKDISGLIDDVDHAAVFSRDDELLRFVFEHTDVYDHDELDNRDEDEIGPCGFMWSEDIEPIGESYIFKGDPTCEILAQWMAERLINQVPAIIYADVTVKETDKYGIQTQAWESAE